jgi:hypothetical protein
METDSGGAPTETVRTSADSSPSHVFPSPDETLIWELPSVRADLTPGALDRSISVPLAEGREGQLVDDWDTFSDDGVYVDIPIVPDLDECA